MSTNASVTSTTRVQTLLSGNKNKALSAIAEKVLAHQPINVDNAITLYEQADLGFAGTLANWLRESLNGNEAYYNRNFHIEPTNICIYNCKFCSYVRKQGQEGSWDYSMDEMVAIAARYQNQPVTEVHIVGGVHPLKDAYFYGDLIKKIKQVLPKVYVKAYTAVELDYMFKKSGMHLDEGLSYLRSCGLDAIPGGGAEIFEPEIRKQICPDKIDGPRWLEIHRQAHKAGISSNATMLYGHLENYRHRAMHMLLLRQVQDETQGFNAFIPLKFRRVNNFFSYLNETTAIEDLKNYAVSRIFLQNIPHIKAYWPMIGRDISQTSLNFGVDDLDGTIDDSTKIYTMAGVTEKNTMTVDEITDLIKSAGRIPVERDTLYNKIIH